MNTLPVIYIDDQPDFKNHIASALLRTGEDTGIKAELTTLKGCEQHEEPLCFDEEGNPVKYSFDISLGNTHNHYASKTAIDEWRLKPGTLFILDVYWPRKPVYGVHIAKYLISKDVPKDHIMLLTGYSKEALDAVANGDRPWLDFWRKEDFCGTNDAQADQFASRLASQIMRGYVSSYKAMVSRLATGMQQQVGIIGQCAAWRTVLDLAIAVAQSTCTVLLRGESGSGKEVVARAIHNSSARKGGPWIPINCGALPKELFESELFGHIKGAFTGAISDKTGLFAAANGGTIFLDEIGTVPADLQYKLLRVLQEKEVRRVGENIPIKIDVRVISATNEPLKERIKDGTFRKDLYYRLCQFPIDLPALRERQEDIPLFVEHFRVKFNADNGWIRMFQQDAMQVLKAYSWPGNVRQVENVVTQVMIIHGQGNLGLITAHEVRRVLASEPEAHKADTVPIDKPSPVPSVVKNGQQNPFDHAVEHIYQLAQVYNSGHSDKPYSTFKYPLAIVLRCAVGDEEARKALTKLVLAAVEEAAKYGLQGVLSCNKRNLQLVVQLCGSHDSLPTCLNPSPESAKFWRKALQLKVHDLTIFGQRIPGANAVPFDGAEVWRQFLSRITKNEIRTIIAERDSKDHQ